MLKASSSKIIANFSKSIASNSCTSYAKTPVGILSRYKGHRSPVWNRRNTSIPFSRSVTISAVRMASASETAGFMFNHTMLRVKDPKISIKFYTEVLGMELISKHDGGDFTLYFLAFDHSSGKLTAEEKEKYRTAREGILELTHNHGTESDPNFQGYHSGNSDPRGFGHIAVSCDNIEAACARFEKLGVTFQKRLTDGKMKHIAFIKDPDGYWVEIVQKTRSTNEP